ncbi:MAG TPA: oligosaccharide flippase family protein [Polyangia bacterium]|nr:oligosaccharide flippase family protein [Polyangia bacterium]
MANAVVKAASVPIEKVCRLLLMLVAAPALGVAGFGSYQFAFATTSMLAVCTDLGMSVWTTRALARDRAAAPAIVGTALRLRLIASGPYLVIVAAAAVASGGVAGHTLALLGLAALLNAGLDYLAAVFRGFERLADEARLNVARALFALITGLCALQLRRSPAALAGGLLAGVTVTAAYGLVLLRRRYGLGFQASGRRIPGAARAAFGEAFPLWLATLLSLLYFKGDVVILKVFSTDAEIGAYSAAYKVFEGLMIVPAVVLAATFTPLARAKADPDRQRRWEGALMAVLLALGVLVGGGVYLESHRIVGLVYRGGFARAIPSLRVLATAVPILFLNFGLTHFLIARDLERRNLLFAAFMLVVNVTANLILIPRFGGTGAAWATLITELALTACCVAALAAGRRDPHP